MIFKVSHQITDEKCKGTTKIVKVRNVEVGMIKKKKVYDENNQNTKR